MQKEWGKPVKKQYLEIGQIVTTHGIAGEVRVKPWCDSPELLCEFDCLYFDGGEKETRVERARVHKNVVVMKLKGVDTMDDALKLRNKVLFADRDEFELEEGTYFIQDLLGLEVIDADSGKRYGRIVDVTQTGANDVYHVKGENGKELLVPAIADVVLETDVEGGRMVIRPLKGLFDDEN